MLTTLVILAMSISGAVLAYCLLRSGATYDQSMSLDAEDKDDDP